jgi:hypothetical protein
MNTMRRAHQYAREHREEYPSYKEALREGLKLAHAEARAVKEEPGTIRRWPFEARRAKEQPQMEHELFEAYDTPELRAAAIIREGVQRYRARTPLLLRDWKADNYNGRTDFCRYIAPRV